MPLSLALETIGPSVPIAPPPAPGVVIALTGERRIEGAACVEREAVGHKLDVMDGLFVVAIDAGYHVAEAAAFARGDDLLFDGDVEETPAGYVLRFALRLAPLSEGPHLVHVACYTHVSNVVWMVEPVT